jgi:hypothetical protein
VSKLQQWLGLVVTLITILGAVGKVWSDANAHAAAAAVENDRLHRELHQLKRIVISEFPAYTAAIEWDDK